MKTLIQLLVVLTVVGFGARAPQAHHSFAATFKSDETIAVEGVVTEFSFTNPHILVYLDVTDADGSVTNWMSEGAAANLMRRSGWDRDTLESGDVIRVHGNSTHDGSPMVSIESIDVLEGGAVVRTLSRDRRGARARAAAAVDTATLPLRLADGRPNLTGAWIQDFGARRGPPGSEDPPVPLSEAGEAAQAAFDPANDPQIFCDPPGLVRQAGMTPHPLRITQNDDHVVFEWEEYGGRRIVYFGDELALPGPGTYLGDSIARYEGDTLVVETVNLMGGNPSNPSGYPLSDRTTTVERYSRADDSRNIPTISIEVAVTDPVNLSDTWTMRRSKVYSAGYEFIENDCRPPLRERR